MDWLQFITTIISRVPFERFIIPRPDHTKALKDFAEGLPRTESQKETPPGAKTMESTRTPEKVPQSASTGVITREGLDTKRLAWQEDIALGEVWLLEGHLKNNCIGCGGDLECCWKHSDNVIRVAGETLSMTTDPFWQNLKALGQAIRDKSHPDDVKRGTYVAEYPGFAVRLSQFRVPLQKKAMERSRPQVTLEEAKKLAAEEASRRVEQSWGKK